MLLKEAQPTIHKLRRREAAGLEHDPASLSAELRELAVQLTASSGRRTDQDRSQRLTLRRECSSTWDRS